MDKETIKNTLEELKTNSQKRKFKQSIDLIITFKNLDLNKPENQIEQFVNLHYGRGKQVKVCGLVGAELIEESKKELDKTIATDDYIIYQKDKKLIKKLATEYDFFIAQANVMPKIAQTFGRVLGPRQKMPNPKAGCVVPPNASLRPLKERLQNMIRVSVKQKPYFQCMIGKEDQKDEEIIDNIMSIYNAVIHALPNEENNVKEVMLKLTMSKTKTVEKHVEDKNE